MATRWMRLAWAITLGAVASLIFVAGMWSGRNTASRPETDLHEMLHRAVPLDANETAVLEAKERAFDTRRAAIEARLRAANADLANAIARDPSWSPAVESAMQQVERAAANLQRETLVHVFEMRNGLKAEHRPVYDQVLLDALRRGAP